LSNGLSVSVVMPLYNKAGYVVAALQSVLAQQPPAMEVLVVDDGSTDDGPQRVAALQAPQVRLLAQANAGVSAARNHGITLARGDLVAFLDADDLWQPGYLAALQALARQFPQAGMLCTGYSRLDATGHRTPVGHARWAPGAAGLITDFYGDWCRASFTCTNAIAVRRALLTAMAPAFAPGERLGEDQDLWFRLAETTAVACCNQPLADYRVQVPHSATQGQAVRDVLPCYQRLADRLARGQVPTPLQAGARRLLASHLINVARARAACGRRADALALLHRPEARGNWAYWLRSLAWVMTRPAGRAA
jgi:cellulose synthase/poly-beta-1,6-N-acetylglucosamine synthase-like glycosyltransferase